MLTTFHQPVYQAKRVRHAGSTDHHQHQMVRLQNTHRSTLTKQQPIIHILPKVASAGLAIYSGLRPIYPAHAIYNVNPWAEGWSRPRGSPRTRWVDVLCKNLKQLGTTLVEASNIATDRIRWRSTIVARAVSAPSWQEPW